MGSAQFRLPDLGEGLEDADVVRWLVSQGDSVTLNQPLIEVDTAKALVEIPSPYSGVVQKLHADEGQTVKVGALLVTFEVDGDDEEETSAKRTAVLVGYGVDESTKPTRRRRLGSAGSASLRRSEDAEPAVSTTVLAAPPVRKLAAQLGVDLSQVRGSGPEGRVTREDVQAHATEERIPIRGVRKLVAEKMSRSAREIPHVTTFITADAGAVLKVRGSLSASGTKVTPLAVIAASFVKICKANPKLNSFISGDEIVLRSEIHLGIATDTERGLIVVVVKNADRKSIVELAESIADLSTAAREGRAKPDDLTGSTVTISNVGSFGAEFGTPIINYPEAAILAVGFIEEKAVAREGIVVVRPSVTLSLSFDHRILDGAEAGRALRDLRDLLQDEERISSL